MTSSESESGTSEPSHLSEVDISGRGYTTIPDGVLSNPDLVRVDANSNRLTTLPEEVYRLKKLRTLLLYRNQLSELSPGIGCLVELKKLNLRSNNLTMLPDEIGCLVNLKHLDLSYNYLVTLPDTIGNLVNLRVLYLSHNKQLVTLPDTIGNLSKLEILNISWNRGFFDYWWCKHLVTLPNTIGNLGSLKVFDLSENKLTTLPDTIGNLVSLVHLSLSYNNLATLPDTIGNLMNLDSLNINKNLLTTLPDTIGNLMNLRTIDLSHNNLATIPDTIGNLGSLKVFDLSHNKLATLPDTMGNLGSLNTLRLSDNKLVTLPDTIGNLGSLRTLDINKNWLTTLPGTISSLINLGYLSLSKNPLTVFPATIGCLVSLVSLYLSKNLLTALPDVIGNLVKLEYLDLSYNRLATLPDTIGNLVSLRTLDINKNRLTTLPGTIGCLMILYNLDASRNQLSSLPSTIGGLASLETISLYRNSLTALPPTISSMGELRTLILSDNQLDVLPDTMGDFQRLECLYLYGNRLRTLPASIRRISSTIRRIDLRMNSLDPHGSTEDGTLGSEELMNIFGTRVRLLSSQPPVSKESVYAHLLTLPLCWNFDELRRLVVANVERTGMTCDEMIEMWEREYQKYLGEYTDEELREDYQEPPMIDIDRVRTNARRTPHLTEDDVGRLVTDAIESNHRNILPRLRFARRRRIDMVSFILYVCNEERNERYRSWYTGGVDGDGSRVEPRYPGDRRYPMRNGWIYHGTYRLNWGDSRRQSVLPRLRSKLETVFLGLRRSSEEARMNGVIVLCEAIQHCTTRQDEDLSSVSRSTSRFLEPGERDMTLSGWIRRHIAERKYEVFNELVLGALEPSPQNVHALVRQRDALKSDLGFPDALEDTMAVYTNMDPYGQGPGGVLERFFKLFTPERMAGEIADMITRSCVDGNDWTMLGQFSEYVRVDLGMDSSTSEIRTGVWPSDPRERYFKYLMGDGRIAATEEEQGEAAGMYCGVTENGVLAVLARMGLVIDNRTQVHPQVQVGS